MREVEEVRREARDLHEKVLEIRGQLVRMMSDLARRRTEDGWSEHVRRKRGLFSRRAGWKPVLSDTFIEEQTMLTT